MKRFIVTVWEAVSLLTLSVCLCVLVRACISVTMGHILMELGGNVGTFMFCPDYDTSNSALVSLIWRRIQWFNFTLPCLLDGPMCVWTHYTTIVISHNTLWFKIWTRVQMPLLVFWLKWITLHQIHKTVLLRHDVMTEVCTETYSKDLRYRIYCKGSSCKNWSISACTERFHFQTRHSCYCNCLC